MTLQPIELNLSFPDYLVSNSSDLCTGNACMQLCQAEFDRVFTYAQYEFITLLVVAAISLFVYIIIHFINNNIELFKISYTQQKALPIIQLIAVELAFLLTVAFIYLALRSL